MKNEFRSKFLVSLACGAIACAVVVLTAFIIAAIALR